MGINSDLFAAAIPDYLECACCLEVLKDPVECCSEAHVLCRKCYIDCKAAGNGCITCQRRMPSEPRPAKTLSRIIRGLDMECFWSVHEKAACTWKGPATDFDQHMRTCTHRPRSCTHKGAGCQFRGSADRMATHLAQECEFAAAVCPRGCGTTYTRVNQNYHAEKCTAWCCMVTPGCPTRNTRKELQAHEVFCASQSQQLRAQRLEIASLKREVLRLKGDVAPKVAANDLLKPGSRIAARMAREHRREMAVSPEVVPHAARLPDLGARPRSVLENPERRRRRSVSGAIEGASGSLLKRARYGSAGVSEKKGE